MKSVNVLLAADKCKYVKNMYNHLSYDIGCDNSKEYLKYKVLNFIKDSGCGKNVLLNCF